MLHQLRIVITDISRHFLPDKVRLLKRLVLRGKLHFGNYQSLILTVELIYLKNMVSAAYQVTGFINNTRLTQFYQLLSFIQRNFFFPFVTADTGCIGCSLNGEIPLPATYAYPHRPSARTADISLNDTVLRVCLRLVFSFYEKFPFYLLRHIYLLNQPKKE